MLRLGVIWWEAKSESLWKIQNVKKYLNTLSLQTKSVQKNKWTTHRKCQKSIWTKSPNVGTNNVSLIKIKQIPYKLNYVIWRIVSSVTYYVCEL